MKIYAVGGAVRDELLGLPVQDRDWVVVGATPDDMAARGFRAVGKDFPCLTHPEGPDGRANHPRTRRPDRLVQSRLTTAAATDAASRRRPRGSKEATRAATTGRDSFREDARPPPTSAGAP